MTSEKAHIGQSYRRESALRHLSGRGQFVTDLALPRMLHAAFVRSPMARGKIVELGVDDAAGSPGVVRVFTAETLNGKCEPWIGTLDHFANMQSSTQNMLADGEVLWVGHPVVMIVAHSRAEAEDACELVMMDIEDDMAVVDGNAALMADSPLASSGISSNMCFQTVLETPDLESAFAQAAHVVEGNFNFGRHTAVTLEPRAIIADFDRSTGQLNVHHGTQTPYQFQDVYARHFGLSEGKVRVIAPDVGGSFGMKLHVYNEEMATVAASLTIGRPVRFVADRLESFVSDIHARDHRVSARMALDADGTIVAMDVDDMTQIGAFSTYPRTSVAEGNQVIRLMGAPYRMPDYRGRLSVVFQNKVQTSQYRAVGHPIACAVTEALVEYAAEKLELDPFEIRHRNLIADDAYPHTSATGYQFEKLSHQASLEKLRALMRYDTLRDEQATLRKQGVYRGIGIATFVEITNPGATFYGVGGARISAQDGAVVRLTPAGDVHCAISVTEQGQGTETIIAQVVADQLGVTPDKVKVVTGDTDTTPSGGATWACRGAGIGGETALRAGRKLQAQILTLAGEILQADPTHLKLANGAVVDATTGNERITLAEIGRIATYRPDTLPNGCDNSLTAAQHFAPSGYPFDFTNGVQASYVEVDIETGITRLLKHWVVEDCGRIINPLLVDEQIRGGVVQGLGPAFFEECLYDDIGQMTNATLAEYLVPMAGEMPDIEIAHIETPTLDTRISQTPMTPLRILKALGHV